MRYKELKEETENWGKIYDYKAVVEVDHNYIYIEIMFEGDGYPDTVCEIHKSKGSIIDLDWPTYKSLPEDARNDLFKIVTEFAATKPEDREDKKRFIIPLPGLVTTDGKQQYLTYKDCRFFASRRDETLMQTWEEGLLELIPEWYRQFTVEFKEGNK